MTRSGRRTIPVPEGAETAVAAARGAANSATRSAFHCGLAQRIIPIHFERTVKPSFPRRRESTPWPHIYGGITVTWY